MAGIGVGAGFNAGLATARQRRYDDEDRQRALARDDLGLESARFSLDQARDDAPRRRARDDLQTQSAQNTLEAQSHALARRPVMEAAEDKANNLAAETGNFNLTTAKTNAAHSNELYQRQLADLKRHGEQEGFDVLIRSLRAGVNPQRAAAQFNQQGDHKIDSIEYDPATDRVKVADRFGGFNGTLGQLETAFGVGPRAPIKLDANDRLIDPTTRETVVPPAARAEPAPTNASFLIPLAQKLARGERLTSGEQRAADLLQRTDALNALIRGSFSGRGPGAGAASGAPAGGDDDDSGYINDARNAIAQGADRNAVRARLKQLGIDPDGAGL